MRAGCPGPSLLRQYGLDVAVLRAILARGAALGVLFCFCCACLASWSIRATRILVPGDALFLLMRRQCSFLLDIPCRGSFDEESEYRNCIAELSVQARGCRFDLAARAGSPSKFERSSK